jgi:hypothetical protein
MTAASAKIMAAVMTPCPPEPLKTMRWDFILTSYETSSDYQPWFDGFYLVSLT